MTTLALERNERLDPDVSGLHIQPVTPVIGAEVSGIDLREELDTKTIDGLRAALYRHKVLFLRDQDITEEQQIRFSRYFGPVTPAHPITNGHKDFPELKVNTLTDSRREYGAAGITVDDPLRSVRRARARGGWHIDITFVANPASISILRGIDIPEFGGDTLFANLEALYDGLSPAFQKLVDGLQAIHTAGTGRHLEPRRDGRYPGPFASLHPLVRIHPVTSRKVLFLSGFIQAIDGLRPAESDALLDFLNDELSGRADLQTRFRWTKNAIAVWDNSAVAHAGPIDGRFLESERIVHRTTIGGDLTKGPDGFVSKSLVGELFNTIS